MRIRGLVAGLAFPLYDLSGGCMPQQPPIVAPVAEAPPPDERVVASSVTVAGESAEGAPRASDADRVRRGPSFFLIGAGYGAVGRIDLTPCRDKGLDPGYVHLHVTFGVGGSIAHAVVESPTQPPAQALACVADLLAAASVPPFEGGDVTLSKSLFVATGVPGDSSGEVFVKSDPKPHSGAGGHPVTLAP
jgi:hypothetical protein